MDYVGLACRSSTGVSCVLCICVLYNIYIRGLLLVLILYSYCTYTVLILYLYCTYIVLILYLYCTYIVLDRIPDLPPIHNMWELYCIFVCVSCNIGISLLVLILYLYYMSWVLGMCVSYNIRGPLLVLMMYLYCTYIVLDSIPIPPSIHNMLRLYCSSVCV